MNNVYLVLKDETGILRPFALFVPDDKYGQADAQAFKKHAGDTIVRVNLVEIVDEINTHCTSACGNDYECPHNDDTETEAI